MESPLHLILFLGFQLTSTGQKIFTKYCLLFHLRLLLGALLQKPCILYCWDLINTCYEVLLLDCQSNRRKKYKLFCLHSIFQDLKSSQAVNYSNIINLLWEETISPLPNVHSMFSVVISQMKKRPPGWLCLRSVLILSLTAGVRQPSIHQVFKIAYCEYFSVHDEMKNKEICQDFVRAIKNHYPEYTKKVKIHLLLHLVDSMISFGPTSAFNTERFDAR